MPISLKKIGIKRRVIESGPKPKSLRSFTVFPNRLLLLILIANFSLLVAQFSLVIWKIPSLPPEIPFFYTLSGAGRLAPQKTLLLVPVILTGVLVLNFYFAQINSKREPAIAYLFMTGSLLASFLSLLGILKIMTLVS